MVISVRRLFVLIIALIFVLSGCRGNNHEEKDRKGEFLPLESLPENYDKEEAEKDGCIINIHGKITNGELFDEFLSNISSEADSFVRIISYTIEGDPIITDVDYKDGIFFVREDNSRDNYGSKDETRFNGLEYKFLKKSEKNDIIYYLTNDENPITDDDKIFPDDSFIIFYGYNGDLSDTQIPGSN